MKGGMEPTEPNLIKEPRKAEPWLLSTLYVHLAHRQTPKWLAANVRPGHGLACSKAACSASIMQLILAKLWHKPPPVCCGHVRSRMFLSKGDKDNSATGPQGALVDLTPRWREARYIRDIVY